MRQTRRIQQPWIESGGAYGYRKIQDDVREVGERCGKHRVYRLVRIAGIRSRTGHRDPAEYGCREQT